MKQLICVLLTAAAIFSASASELNVAGKVLDLNVDWMTPGITALEKRQYISDFIILDQLILFNQMEEGSSLLPCADARTGQSLSPIEIHWNVEHPRTACSFIGLDTSGNPYLASKSGTQFEAAYPFEIYPLDICDGTYTVNRKYTLKLAGIIWPRDPVIIGDICSGTFDVIAPCWPYLFPYENGNSARNQNYLVKWEVRNGKNNGPAAFAQMAISDTSVLPVDNNRFILYDRGFYDQRSDLDFSIPTLAAFNNTANGINIISTFDGRMNNQFGNGLAHANIGGTDIFLYGSGYNPPIYSIACIPSFPDELTNSTTIHTFPREQLSQIYGTITVPNKGQVVHSVKIEENCYQFYTLTNSADMARITITEPQNTISFNNPYTEIQLGSTEHICIPLLNANADTNISITPEDILIPMPGETDRYIVTGQGTATLTAQDSSGNTATTSVTITPASPNFQTVELSFDPESNYEAGMVYLPTLHATADVSTDIYIDGISLTEPKLPLNHGQYRLEAVSHLTEQYLPAYTSMILTVDPKTLPEHITAHIAPDWQESTWFDSQYNTTAEADGTGIYSFTLGMASGENNTAYGHLFFSTWHNASAVSPAHRAEADYNIANYAIYTPETHQTDLSDKITLRRHAPGHNGNPNTLRLPANKQYTLSLNLSHDEPTIEIQSVQTALTDIHCNNQTEASWYTIEGIPANAHQHGFFIIRKGTTISKTFIP